MANAAATSGASSGKPSAGLEEILATGIVAKNMLKGWRLEKNSNGAYRLRWQMKDASGKPITYTTRSGRVGYKRGSEYVTKHEAKQIRDIKPA